MRLSVVIPCYNAAGVIGEQLEALSVQDFGGDWEVLVVDNCSTDNLREAVAPHQRSVPGLRIVDASAQKGQPFALNVGTRHASGDFVVYCDADDVVAPGWLSAISRAFDEFDFVASRFEFSHLNPSWPEGVFPNQQYRGLQSYRDPPFLMHAGGSGLGVKTAWHHAIGGFDERFRLLHDTDFCWRLQLRAVRLGFVKDAVIHIRFRDSVWEAFRQVAGYGEYSVLLYKKHRLNGMPRASVRGSARSWLRLGCLLLRNTDAAKRYSLVRRLGWRFGRLKGCIRFGAVAP